MENRDRSRHLRNISIWSNKRREAVPQLTTRVADDIRTSKILWEKGLMASKICQAQMQKNSSTPEAPPKSIDENPQSNFIWKFGQMNQMQLFLRHFQSKKLNYQKLLNQLISL
ncbi:hypothetical protein PV326_010592, partial [Microctonus aethiopoides]